MTHYLVTGGAGFIGSYLVRALLEKGKHVRVFDNFSTGKYENLSDLNGSLEVIEGDIRNQDQLRAALKGTSIVFHQAAFVSVPGSMQDPETCFGVNVQGTVNVLSAALDAGVNRVVLASSAAVYGDSQNLPLGERLTTQPLSPYATSKLVNELYAQLYSDVFRLPVVALRYFNVYGPRQSPDSDYAAAIPIFIHQLLARNHPTVFGDGEQVRDFIFVADVVRANIIAAENQEITGGIFNICTGEETTILHLLDLISETMDYYPQTKFAPPRSGDIYRSYGNPQLAEKVLRFSAQVSLSQGLAQTVAWMQS